MSGSRVPYHLRHNKAIDRNLFLELLTILNRFVHVSKYTYVGFGGSFLEDFKLIHNQTGIASMISIEKESEVVKRQVFNRPVKCIDFEHIESEKFIEDYNVTKPALIWLDYASAQELPKQLNEVESLVSKLKRGDVLKITLNANVNSIRGDNAKLPTGVVIRDARFQKLYDKYGKYLLGQEKTEIHKLIDEKGYPKILCKILKFAINQGTTGLPFYFQPLTTFAYNDSFHTMLTFCGIMLNRKEEKDFFRQTDIKKWKLGSVDGETVHKIDIPELSIRERLLIDSLLPSYSAARILKKLKFYTGRDEAESLEEIENYKKYYRHYPYFSKMLP